MGSEAGDTHIIRHRPRWLVEVDLSALGLEESVVASLPDGLAISLKGPRGAELSLNTCRVVHDEQSGVRRVRVDAWFFAEDVD
jgi:hypothetical protein